jgi:hypothetical protein
VGVTRRTALAGGAGLLLAAVPLARADDPGDAGTLRRMILLEQLAAAGLGAAATGDVLGAEVARRLLPLADHDRRHVDALAANLDALGGIVPRAPKSVEGADRLAVALGVPLLSGVLAGEREFLAWAIAVKRRLLAGYVEAARRLQEINLTQTLATILASDAQHLVVLRRLAHETPVPAAFEVTP